MKFENSVIINRPINKVFDFITDFNNNPIWQSDILELAITSEGRFGLGSTYRCVNRFMGKRIESKGVITEYVPDRACSFQIKSGSIRGESNFFFETVNGSTKFTTTADLDLKFFILGRTIIKRKIYKQMKNDMLQLKSILENGGGAGHPAAKDW